MMLVAKVNILRYDALILIVRLWLLVNAFLSILVLKGSYPMNER